MGDLPQNRHWRAKVGKQAQIWACWATAKVGVKNKKTSGRNIAGRWAW